MMSAMASWEAKGFGAKSTVTSCPALSGTEGCPEPRALRTITRRAGHLTCHTLGSNADSIFTRRGDFRQTILPASAFVISTVQRVKVTNQGRLSGSVG